jgi:hypothetical protein
MYCKKKKTMEKIFANMVKIAISSMQSLAQDNKFSPMTQVAKLAKIFFWQNFYVYGMTSIQVQGSSS